MTVLGIMRGSLSSWSSSSLALKGCGRLFHQSVASSSRSPLCKGAWFMRDFGRRYQVSFAVILEQAHSVTPCYAIVQRQLNPEVVETPKRGEESLDRQWGHSINWRWEQHEIEVDGLGRNRRAAKNEAARELLKQLLCLEAQIMDPSQNGALAQWAIEWLNKRLDACMELEEALSEEDGAEFAGAGEHSHTCTWSCPHIEGEFSAQGSAASAAESRRQAISALYRDLPSNLEEIFTRINNAAAQGSEQQGSARSQSRALDKRNSEINAMHNNVCQKLGLQSQHQYTKLGEAEFECTVTWRGIAEARGTGRSKVAAKAAANAQILMAQGHMYDATEEFLQSSTDIKTALVEGRVSEAANIAIELMQGTAPDASGWFTFLPEVLRATLAEGDDVTTTLLVTALRGLHDEGTPVELWEALLDEASYSMRHYHMASAALEQLRNFPLAQEQFPGQQEREYFSRFRHLLALERHGALLHGIQQYELDSSQACSVPTVDIHHMEADMVVLTSTPESGIAELMDGARALRSTDLVLLVPMEEVLDPGYQEFGFMDEGRSTNWQHPEAWLASVTSVKGNPQFGEEVKIHTRRISRFGRSLDGNEIVNPISLGRQYRLYYISMETPMHRMLTALRCLCRPKLPVWSEGFEGRKLTYQFDEDLRTVLLGAPEDSQNRAVESVRQALGTLSPSDTLERLCQQPAFAMLTASQRDAVSNAMEQRLSLIQGPPGTGKTHVACAVIAAWVEKYSKGLGGERILAVADSNVAADNIHNRLQAFGIASVRAGQGKEVDSIVGDALWRALQDANVVIATCIGSGMEILNNRGSERSVFSRVVVDECTQACETAALVAMGRGCEQVVLIGDHAQLPATVLSKLAQRDGLGISLFERMVRTNDIAPTVLLEQRRMHSSIAEFPNNSFYNGQLVNATNDEELVAPEGFPWPNPDCRVCFVDVSPPHAMEGKRGFSAFNMEEANAVVKVLRDILQAGFPASNVCVLTAYVAQRNEILRAIYDQGLGHLIPSSAVDTIDGYQGNEKDLVIFSATRSNAESMLGFLSDARRMNVMLTRAKRGLIIFGNASTLRHSQAVDSYWRSWLEWVESKGAATSMHALGIPASTPDIASETGGTYQSQFDMDQQQHSVDQQEHPLQSEQQTVDYQQHSVDQQEHPWQSEQQPVEYQQFAMNEGSQPSSGQSQEHPYQQHTADQKDQPWQSEQQPVDLQQRAMSEGSQSHTVDQQENPWQSEQQPVDHQQFAMNKGFQPHSGQSQQQFPLDQGNSHQQYGMEQKQFSMDQYSSQQSSGSRPVGQIWQAKEQQAGAPRLNGTPPASSVPPPPPPPPLPIWEKVYSEEYKQFYYWNTQTNVTQWEAPPQFASS